MNPSLDPATVADYLSTHPLFFEAYADLLAGLKLTSPIAGRTVSLQDRQMEVLREKIKLLELRMAGLMGIAQENDLISEKFEIWTRALLMVRNEADLPDTLIKGLQDVFSVPQATLRIWSVAEQFRQAWFAAPVSEDSRIFSNGLRAPFCGMNNDFEAVSWLEGGTAVASVALLPLRANGTEDVFGLMVLGSTDPGRFASNMSTDFLAKIGATASAALACLLD